MQTYNIWRNLGLNKGRRHCRVHARSVFIKALAKICVAVVGNFGKRSLCWALFNTSDLLYLHTLEGLGYLSRLFWRWRDPICYTFGDYNSIILSFSGAPWILIEILTPWRHRVINNYAKRMQKQRVHVQGCWDIPDIKNHYCISLFS